MEVLRHPGEATPQPTRVKLFNTFKVGAYGHSIRSQAQRGGPDGICD